LKEKDENTLIETENEQLQKEAALLYSKYSKTKLCQVITSLKYSKLKQDNQMQIQRHEQMINNLEE